MKRKLKSGTALKTRILCTVIIIALCAMTGCGTQSSTTSSDPTSTLDGASASQPASASEQQTQKSFDGVSVRVLRNNNARDNVTWQDRLDKLYEETGIKAEMEMVAFSNLHDKIVLDASTGGGTFDVTSMVDYWIGGFAGAGWLEPLDDYLVDETLPGVADYNASDIPEAVWDMVSHDGHVYGLAYKLNDMVFCYRTDLIETPPKTWDEWLQMAAENNKDGVSGVGMCLNPAASDFVLTMMYTNGASIVGGDLKTCTFDSPRTIEAFEFIKELYQYSVPGAINNQWDESSALFGQGQMATDLLISSQIGNLEDPEYSNYVDVTGYAPPPYKTTPATAANSWNAGVFASSKNKEAAAIVAMAVTDTQTSRIYAMEGNIPVRRGLMSDPEITAVNRVLLMQMELSEICVPNPSLSNTSSINNVIGNQLQAYILGEKDVQTAVSDAAAEIEKLL